MPTNQLYLGLDVGGTKTEAVIYDGFGAVLGTGRAGGANLHNSGLPTLIQNVETAIASTGVNLASPNFEAMCLGIAGLDTKNELTSVQTELEAHFKPGKLLLYNDGYIGLKSGTDLDYGVCIIASTGSNCLAINPAGDQAKAGDWGYLLGDQGSGFNLGLNLLKLAVKEFDGRQPNSGLFDLVCHQFNLHGFDDLVKFIYQDHPPISAISNLSGLISDPEFANRPDILALTQDTVNSLFEAFQAVVNKTNLVSDRFPVVLVGKLFLAKDSITKPLSSLITDHCPLSTIILPNISPAEAAAKLAWNSCQPKSSP